MPAVVLVFVHSGSLGQQLLFSWALLSRLCRLNLGVPFKFEMPRLCCRNTLLPWELPALSWSGAHWAFRVDEHVQRAATALLSGCSFRTVLCCHRG